MFDFRYLLASVLCLSPAPVLAGLEICNDTEVRQSVALGYKKDGQWISEGWYNFDPDQCRTLLSGDLKNRYYYVTATAKGWSFDDEKIAFCVQNEAFDITGDEDCEARGYLKAHFRAIDTGKTAKTFRYALGAYSRPNEPEPVEMGPPGTYGEPYSAAGVFQGCGAEDGPYHCAFYAEGYKILVYDRAPTPKSVLQFMKALSPGDPVSATGDLAAVYDSSAELVARSVTDRPWTEADTLLSLMQGRWQSVEDPFSEIWISGSEKTGVYDGDTLSIEAITLRTWCEDFSDGGLYLNLRDIETGETYCYTVENAETESLSLMYLPRGNFLDYRRIK